MVFIKCHFVTSWFNRTKVPFWVATSSDMSDECFCREIYLQLLTVNLIDRSLKLSKPKMESRPIRIFSLVFTRNVLSSLEMGHLE